MSRRWLKERRAASGLTLRQLAKILGVSSAYICQMETGERPILPNMAAAYVAVLGRGTK